MEEKTEKKYVFDYSKFLLLISALRETTSPTSFVFDDAIVNSMRKYALEEAIYVLDPVSNTKKWTLKNYPGICISNIFISEEPLFLSRKMNMPETLREAYRLNDKNKIAEMEARIQAKLELMYQKKYGKE